MASESEPLITTVIPTFRRPAMLRRAVSSVLNQNIAQVQACVYDNASGDGTADVVAVLSRLDSRVKYHCHAENLGAAANFEFGLRAVETPYFSILSDDDYLIPGFYRRAIEDLSLNPDAMFWAGLTMTVDEAGVLWDARVARWPREGRFEPPEGVMRLTGGMSPTWTGIVFRREVLSQLGFPDQEALGPSDLDFILRIASRYPYMLYKVPAAVFTLNSTSYSATQPLSSFWPGWKKLLQNVSVDSSLKAADRAELLRRLHADARRMLVRRGANAIAQGRRDFARDAADALRSEYSLGGWATLLRVAAGLCGKSAAIDFVYRTAYALAERGIIKSKFELQQKYGGLISQGD